MSQSLPETRYIVNWLNSDSRHEMHYQVNDHFIYSLKTADRIKIWTETGGVETIVYDNGMDQNIGGGSIVVHNGK